MSTRVMGTYGYAAPEYVMTGMASGHLGNFLSRSPRFMIVTIIIINNNSDSNNTIILLARLNLEGFFLKLPP